MSLSPALLSALAELAKDLPGSAAATLARELLRTNPADSEADLRRRSGLPLNQQAAVERLMRQWQVESAPPSGEVLAAALDAMSAYDTLLRKELHAEVVWTGPRAAASALRRTAVGPHRPSGSRPKRSRFFGHSSTWIR